MNIPSFEVNLPPFDVNIITKGASQDISNLDKIDNTFKQEKFEKEELEAYEKVIEEEKTPEELETDEQKLINLQQELFESDKRKYNMGVLDNIIKSLGIEPFINIGSMTEIEYNKILLKGKELIEKYKDDKFNKFINEIDALALELKNRGNVKVILENIEIDITDDIDGIHNVYLYTEGAHNY
jgi:hypothetical protein